MKMRVCWGALIGFAGVVSGTPAFAMHHWDGTKVSFGFNSTMGNTESLATNGEADIDYLSKDSRWKTTTKTAFQYGTSNGTKNKEQYSTQVQLAYSFNDDKNTDNYVYLKGFYQMNKYAAYLTQLTLTPGYGRDWVKTDKFQFSTQAGPSYRDSLADAAGAKHKHDLAGSLSIIMKWSCFAHGKLEEDLDFTAGKPANTIKSVSSYTDNLSKKLALSLSYTIDAVSKIPEGTTQTKKIDTATAANLVYSF